MAQGINKDKHIFLKLKSSSSSIAYDGLVGIRSNIMKTKEGCKILKENNILNELVNFLRKPNEKILDVTLSILGNCCLDNDCRNEVVSYGIVSPLASIIHNISRDSIQCRACRLVGNLAQELCFAEQLHNENITPSIVALLDTDSGSSIATRQMAVRALRMLWKVTSQREKMLNCRVVHAVALLLPGNQESVGEQHLLLEVVKALAAFTSCCSEECAQQVQGSGSGFQHLMSLVAYPSLKYLALECICNLCHATSSRPALGNVGTVKIVIRELSCHQQDSTEFHTEMVLALCNLCRESVNRAKIRHGGGLPLMLRIIRNSSVASLRSSVVNALVQFMYDEKSLQELLGEGLVSTLICKITDFVKENGRAHSKSIVHEESAKDSVKDGSCNDNVDSASDTRRHLSPILRSSCTSSGLNRADREPQSSRRRFRANSPSYQAVVKEQVHTARHCREPSPDYCASGDWSPGSPSSMCFSPDASPPQWRKQAACPSVGSASDGLSPPSSPPTSYSEVFEDVDYPEAYSPICCDPGDVDDNGENEHEPRPREEEEDDDDDDDDELAACFVSGDTSEDRNSEHVALSPDSKRSVEDSKHLCDGELDAALILLSRVSHMDSPVEELAAHSTFATLIAYVTLIRDPHPRASRILFRIIRNHHYFMSLLLHRFVPTVQSHLCQPQHSACWLCSEFKSIGLSLLSQITMLAHSGFGEGELAHHLLKGEVLVQRLLAVSVPHIVRTQRILWKLLVECDALRTLVHMLDDGVTGDDGLRKHVPVSLTLVAGALDVANPCHHTKGIHDHDKCPDNMDETGSGSFVIPSGTEASDDVVFLLLDDGTTIQVSKMQLCLRSPVFEAMFRGDFRESNEECVPLPGISRHCLLGLLRILKLGGVPSGVPDIDLTTSLELVAVLDRFLIPGSERLTDMIVGKFMSHRTAVDIYIRCMEAGDVSHFHSLRYDTVRFVLTSDAAPSKTEKIFEDLLQCPYRKQVLTDITDILQERLNHIPCKPSRIALLKKSL
ncbi:armadillo repeat-containing protein 5 [Zootermopsis nevadensis]|nr:armadillo repeat-containing protein 5 [Zootermopsis nevadensis]